MPNFSQGIHQDGSQICQTHLEHPHQRRQLQNNLNKQSRRLFRKANISLSETRDWNLGPLHGSFCINTYIQNVRIKNALVKIITSTYQA